MYFEAVISISTMLHFGLVFVLIMYCVSHLGRSWVAIFLFMNPVLLIVYTLLTRDALIALLVVLVLRRQFSNVGASIVTVFLSVLKIQLLPFFVCIYVMSYDFGFKTKLAVEVSKIAIVTVFFTLIFGFMVYTNLVDSWAQGLGYRNIYENIFWFSCLYIFFSGGQRVLADLAISYKSIAICMIIFVYSAVIIGYEPAPDIVRWLTLPYLVLLFMAFAPKEMGRS